MANADRADACASYYDPDHLEAGHVMKSVDIKGKDVLLVGCDAGKLLSRLSGFKRMTVIESDTDALEHWKKKTRDRAVEFVLATIGKTGLPDASFDIIIASRLLLPADRFGSAVWDLSRLLRPQGKLVFVQESGLGDYEEVKDRFCPGYRKLVRLNNAELKRQLERFFAKTSQTNLAIPDVYPDMSTAIEVFTFDMNICTKKCDIDTGRQKEALARFEREGKVIIPKGVIVVEASG